MITYALYEATILKSLLENTRNTDTGNLVYRRNNIMAVKKETVRIKIDRSSLFSKTTLKREEINAEAALLSQETMIKEFCRKYDIGIFLSDDIKSGIKACRKSAMNPFTHTQISSYNSRWELTVSTERLNQIAEISRQTVQK